MLISVCRNVVNRCDTKEAVFPQFELSFSLKVKYQFAFKSSLFIFLADNRQKHRVSLEKCSPNTQTFALMSRYLRCVIMSHRVSRGGIEGNCFRVHLQCCYAVLRFLLNWSWISLLFSVVSVLNAVTSAPHERSLFPLLASDYPHSVSILTLPVIVCALTISLSVEREIFTLLKIFSVRIPFKFTKSCTCARVSASAFSL